MLGNFLWFEPPFLPIITNTYDQFGGRLTPPPHNNCKNNFFTSSHPPTPKMKHVSFFWFCTFPRKEKTHSAIDWNIFISAYVHRRSWCFWKNLLSCGTNWHFAVQHKWFSINREKTFDLQIQNNVIKPYSMNSFPQTMSLNILPLGWGSKHVLLLSLFGIKRVKKRPIWA